MSGHVRGDARKRHEPTDDALAKAWDEGLRAAHKALGAPFIWFAPENPYARQEQGS